MQSVDFTTLIASCTELSSKWLPARLEQVYQKDRYTIVIALRTLQERAWLTLAWHPQAARICLGDPPPRHLDTFTLSEQLRHQLNGYALTKIATLAPWERVINLQMAKRPGEAPIYHLYLEVMGKYSNLVLTDTNNQVITVAHQVTSSQSSVRTLQTGQPYTPPPAVLKDLPTQPFKVWQETLQLIPGKIQRQLLANYQGVSPVVARTLLEKADVIPDLSTELLTQDNWHSLYQQWQKWLLALETGEFEPGTTSNGYTVLGWQISEPVKSTQVLLNNYYRDILKEEEFQQLHHQLRQKVSNHLLKLNLKAKTFQDRLQQSENADLYKEQGDLLLAYSHQWQPGMKSITLPDFATNQPVTIPLLPDKSIIPNAQLIYKQHRKLKRVRQSVEPLLLEVQMEISYLDNVLSSLNQLETYQTLEDWKTLEEIQQELIAQQYIETLRPPVPKEESKPRSYQSPSGFEVLIGRNNRQNDLITFRLANDYDIWFHAQQIAGSHVLLRLQPGSIPEQLDLQYAADWTAYHSQARASEQVPVIYTLPKHVYKPKGAKPGMVIYKHEQVLWGRPSRVSKK